jgi:orotate phosphoribosyltransferase
MREIKMRYYRIFHDLMQGARAALRGARPRYPDHNSAPLHDARDPLEEIIHRKSFGRAAVTLSSGKPSTFYFDMKPSMLDPEGAHFIADRILHEAAAAGAEFIGGLEMGAVPIAGAVCQLSYKSGSPLHGFFVRKMAKEHGAKKLIEGLPKDETLLGKRTVIIDDVTTSGHSALVAVRACKAVGAEVVMVISIVDREEGAAETFANEKIPFKSLFTASTFLARKTSGAG